MKLILTEYNVVPNIEEKDEINIVVGDNKILYNHQEISDNNKINSINELIIEYKDSIIKLKSIDIPSYRGGRQETIEIQFDNSNEIYNIIGNTPIDESSNLYNIIKEKLINIIEK